MQVVQAVTSGQNASEKTLCVFIDADARAVVTAARDCVHHGWKLLHQRLYGNYRPYQQPFRSLLLTSPASGTAGPDMASLHLIEEALLVYNSNKALFPAEAPALLRDDCAFLDYELMRLPLEQSGVVLEGHAPSVSPEQGEENFRNCA